jgi:site-specific recombinase XerD
LVAVRKDRDTKAELNRRSQACEVLTGTGIRVAENESLSSEALAKEDRASGYRALYSGLEDRRVSLNTYARKNGIPCWNCTSLCGFANRRLN